MPEVTLNLPTPPEGYEYTGEFRCSEPGELSVDEYGHWFKRAFRSSAPCPVIAKKRWRAGPRSNYFFVSEQGSVRETIDVRSPIDNSLYGLGNYFQTEAEAKIMAQKVKQLFKENL